MTDPITLRVDDVWVRRRSATFRRSWKITLARATVTVAPGQLVAIIGPNGAGKTTLMRSIAGERPARGDVRLNGQSLFQPGGPEYWLPRMGYVPVDSVLHEQLTVQQALSYVARLRLPRISEKQRQTRINHLLTEFEFPADRRKQQLHTLSSGERKRVNICAELLTLPRLILLDEPTSNLDPNAERNLMDKLRARAEKSKLTILLVTHTLNTLDRCHRVVFVANGAVLADGTPDEVRKQLAQQGAPLQPQFEAWSDIFDNYRTEERSDQKTLYSQFVTGLGKAPPAATPLPVKTKSTAPRWWQFPVLFQRYLRLHLNSWQATLGKLALGVVGGLCLFVLPTDALISNRADNVDISDARTAFFLIGLVIALIGMLSSFQEISREWRIYEHERIKGLSPWAYLASKWALLSLIVGVIAPISLVLILVFVQGQPLQPPPPPPGQQTALTSHGVILAAQIPWFTDMSAAIPEQARAFMVTINTEALVSLILACIAAITLGLVISAWSRADNVASAVLALVVIFHVFFSGLSTNPALDWLINPLANFATSHWAIRGFSVSNAVYCWTPGRLRDFYSLGFLSSIWIALLAYVAGAFALAYLALRLRDTWAPWRASLGRVLSELPFLTLVTVTLVGASWSFFLRERSRDYFELESNRGVVQVSTLPRESFNTLQWAYGLVSQAHCPIPEMPSAPAPIVAPPVQPVPVAPTTEVNSSPTTVASAPTQEPTSEQTPAPTLEPTLEPTIAPTLEPTLEPTAVQPPAMLSSLPEGRITSATSLRYGPEHDVLLNLTAGEPVTLLARDRSGEWLRILWRSQDQQLNVVGWVPASATDLRPRDTGDVPTPPACAIPVARFTDQEPSWHNPGDTSSTTLVIDVFRAANGPATPATTLQVLVNNQPSRQVAVPSTQGTFLLQRSTIGGLNVPNGAAVSVGLPGYPADREPVAFFGTLFLVPPNCTFQ